MNHENNGLGDLPEAEIQEKKRGLPVVWLLPLVAVLIGAWLVFKTFSEEGPRITIEFESAEGIEANKTKLKFRNVDIGLVESVDVSEDLSHISVTAKMEHGSEGHLTDTTRFWVVRPRFGARGVSGVGTLLSGAYIAMDPGEGGKRKRHFKGLEEPPIVLSDIAGTRYKLRSPGLGSLSVGSPIFFRQIPVGEVLKYRMADDHSHVDIDIFVRAPHDQYIYQDTRFWNASGLNLEIGTGGVKLGLESLTSLLSGGVGFASPEEGQVSQERAPAGTVFPLYASQEQSQENPITVKIPYRLHFEDNVRGLSVGAPVEFRGIRIGTVTNFFVLVREKGVEFTIAVEIELEPERVPTSDKDPGDRQARARRVEQEIEEMVKKGLRARLETGNLLTGQLLVDFNMYPDAEPAEIGRDGDYALLPTVPSKMTNLSNTLSRLLTQLDQLPIAEIGRNLEETTAGASRLVNDKQLHEAIGNLNSALASVNKNLTPMLNNLNKASADARVLINKSVTTVEQARDTLAAFESVASEDGPIGGQLLRTLEELSAAVRAIRIMAEYLQRHPEALLKGKGAQ